MIETNQKKAQEDAIYHVKILLGYRQIDGIEASHNTTIHFQRLCASLGIGRWLDAEATQLFQKMDVTKRGEPIYEHVGTVIRPAYYVASDDGVDIMIGARGFNSAERDILLATVTTAGVDFLIDSNEFISESQHYMGEGLKKKNWW